MALSVFVPFFFTQVSAWCLFLLGMPNCQAHLGQHRKPGANWNVTGFTFQKQRTGKQGVSMGICTFKGADKK